MSDGHRRVLATLDTAGDEPLMLARALPGVPVLVGADRYLSGRLAERQLGVTVHLLDDGFQHLQLERDVDLLLVSEEDLDDHPLPAGRLRESLDAARTADAALVTAGYDTAAERIGRALSLSTVFRVTRAIAPPRIRRRRRTSRSWCRPPRACSSSCGIARPDRFFADLAAAGWQIAGTMTFRDHHRFTARDLDRVITAATSARSSIVLTTEKDAVRLAALDLKGAPIAALPLVVGVEPRIASRRGSGIGFEPAAMRHDGMKHRLEYFLALAAMALVRILPGCARALDRLDRGSDRSTSSIVPHRRIANANLVAAFPTRGASERRAIARGAFEHFGRLLFELLKFSTLTPSRCWRGSSSKARSACAPAYAQGKGVLFVTGHFGFWELHALVHALEFEPMACWPGRSTIRS